MGTAPAPLADRWGPFRFEGLAEVRQIDGQIRMVLDPSGGEAVDPHVADEARTTARFQHSRKADWTHEQSIIRNNYPKLHNAAWPGVVGKGGEGAEPFIDLDTMLDLTAAAEVDGVKFDGFDLFLFLPHINIDASDDELKTLADKASSRGLAIGSVVAPVWPPTGGGSALDAGAGRKKFLEQVEKGCRIARRLRELGVRKYGVVRIDSASGVSDWAADPEGNQQQIAETFKQAAAIAKDHGEKLAAEGEICWGGMHSWRRMVRTCWKPAAASRRARTSSVSRPTWPTPSSTPSAKTPPRTASCPPTTTGKTRPSSTAPSRR